MPDLSYTEIEALVSRAKAGDRKATHDVLCLCEHLVASAVRSISDAVPSERDDLAQVGRIALWHALSTYDPTRSAWLGYAARAVNRAVVKAGIKQRRHQHETLDHELSGDAPTPLEHALAIEAAEEWHHQRDEQIAAARRVAERFIADGGLSKAEEISQRRIHGIPLLPAEPLPWIAHPVHATRCAIVAQLVIDLHRSREWSDKESSATKTKGGGFFLSRETRQDAGAPKIDPRGLFSLRPKKQ